jgi:hypothetical protein
LQKYKIIFAWENASHLLLLPFCFLLSPLNQRQGAALTLGQAVAAGGAAVRTGYQGARSGFALHDLQHVAPAPPAAAPAPRAAAFVNADDLAFSRFLEVQVAQRPQRRPQEQKPCDSVCGCLHLLFLQKNLLLKLGFPHNLWRYPKNHRSGNNFPAACFFAAHAGNDALFFEPA